MSNSDMAKKIEALMVRLDREARAGGYNLNPDTEFTQALCEGLQTNLERYGYMACPCRLAAGDRQEDIDIICPCDYRDPDLSEFGACYCALYVSDEIAKGQKQASSIPERRPSEEERKAAAKPAAAPARGLWRCKVCGYLCAMDHPPGKCPVCKADRDRFEAFSLAAPATPVHRCKVCGYLCAAENPPGKCPVCKADRDRFEAFS